MKNKFTLRDDILEKTTPVISATLVDTDGAAISSASLDTFILDLYNLDTNKTVINGRAAQNILNVNNVTVNVNGLVIWDVQVADTAIIDTNVDFELRRAVFSWSYNSNTKFGRYIIDMRIINLIKIL